MDIAKKFLTFVENQRIINEKLNDKAFKPYDSGYADGVASVPNPLEFAYSTHYGQAEFPDGYELEIDMPNVGSLEYSFIAATGVKKVTIKGNKNGNALNFDSAFKDCSVEIVDFTDFIVKPLSANYAFHNAKFLREIKGIVDLRSCTSANNCFTGCSALEELRFLPLSIAYGLTFMTSPLLSAETRQSIVEALIKNNTTTPWILMLHSDVVMKFTQEQILEITNKNWSIQ